MWLQEKHPVVYKLANLLEDAEEVSSQLRDQAKRSIINDGISHQTCTKRVQQELLASIHQTHPGVTTTIISPDTHPDGRTLTPRHSKNDRGIQRRDPDHADPTTITRYNTTTTSPIPSSKKRGHSVTKKLTGGSAQPGTTHPSPSRTRLQTATVHGDVR